MKIFEEVGIKSIESIGFDETYDIEMPEIHNFVLSNGIVSHNSHSNMYSHMSYWSQWLKSTHPLEFWTASLNFADEEDVPKRISEMKKLKQGITLRPPSVNKSTKIFDCDSETQTIYWSLSKIKGFGGTGVAVDTILKERELNGMFKNYDDFVKRFPKKVTRAHILALIVCGAFDEVEGLTKEIDRFKLIKKHYDRLNKSIPNQDKWETIPPIYLVEEAKKNYYWILLQRDLTGYGDVDYRSILLTHSNKVLGKKMSSLFVNGEQFNKAKDYTEVSIAGLITYASERTTKKNEKYIIINVISNNDFMIAIFWPDSYDKNKEFFDNCLTKTACLTGKVKFDEWRGCNVLFGNDDSKILEL